MKTEPQTSNLEFVTDVPGNYNAQIIIYPDGYAVTGAKTLILVSNSILQAAQDFHHLLKEDEIQETIKSLIQKIYDKTTEVA